VLSSDSPCIDAADPALTDPDGTRRDMGACHFPFISITCSPEEVILAPGQVLPLVLTAGNLLADPSFPVCVEVVARLPNGYEMPLAGPIPAAGIQLPAESSLSGTVRLRVPGNAPDGLQAVLRVVLSSAETGAFVHEDYCDVTVSSSF
jgi:hypothetical protein